MSLKPSLDDAESIAVGQHELLQRHMLHWAIWIVSKLQERTIWSSMIYTLIPTPWLGSLDARTGSGRMQGEGAVGTGKGEAQRLLLDVIALPHVPLKFPKLRRLYWICEMIPRPW